MVSEWSWNAVIKNIDKRCTDQKHRQTRQRYWSKLSCNFVAEDEITKTREKCMQRTNTSLSKSDTTSLGVGYVTLSSMACLKAGVPLYRSTSLELFVDIEYIIVVESWWHKRMSRWCHWTYYTSMKNRLNRLRSLPWRSKPWTIPSPLT